MPDKKRLRGGRVCVTNALRVGRHGGRSRLGLWQQEQKLAGSNLSDQEEERVFVVSWLLLSPFVFFWGPQSVGLVFPHPGQAANPLWKHPYRYTQQCVPLTLAFLGLLRSY